MRILMKKGNYNYRKYNIIKGTIGIILLIVVVILLVTGNLKFDNSGRKITWYLKLVNETESSYYGKFYFKNDSTQFGSFDSYLNEIIIEIEPESTKKTEIELKDIKHAYTLKRSAGSELYLYLFNQQNPDSIKYRFIMRPEYLLTRDCTFYIK